ncbi:MAG: NAD(P)H-binding protein [Methylococcaceae bacterium]
MKNNISILGSGWLGLPLIESFLNNGYSVKASTTSVNKVAQLAALKAEPFVVDIDNITANIQTFLQSEVLIINIPSKNISGFKTLVDHIEKSVVKKVLFVGSTSIYDNINTTIDESSGDEITNKPLYQIENLFKDNDKVATTIVRFAGLIGYGRHPGRFFANGKVIKDPDSLVNLIHRDDCIAIITQIIAKQIWNEDFNCCADTHPSKREYYAKAVKSLGGGMPEFATQSSAAFKIISNKKVKQYLNYTFLHADLMENIDHL